MKITRTDGKETNPKWHIRSKVHQIMTLIGDQGVIAKTALLTGMHVDELFYSYNQELCDGDQCRCDKLHVTNRPNGVTIVVINWIRQGKACYFAMLPSGLWSRFRGRVSFGNSDIALCQQILGKVDLSFAKIRRMNHQILRSELNGFEMRVWVGKLNRHKQNICYIVSIRLSPNILRLGTRLQALFCLYFNAVVRVCYTKTD